MSDVETESESDNLSTDTIPVATEDNLQHRATYRLLPETIVEKMPVQDQSKTMLTHSLQIPKQGTFLNPTLRNPSNSRPIIDENDITRVDNFLSNLVSNYRAGLINLDIVID